MRHNYPTPSYEPIIPAPRRLYSTRECSKRLPFPSTKNVILNWVHRGLLAPDGNRVYLPCSRMGNRILIDLPDFENFLAIFRSEGESKLRQEQSKQPKQHGNRKAV